MDEGVLSLVLNLLPVFMLLMLGLIVGGTVQRRHFASIARRKVDFEDIFVTQLKSFPQWTHGEKPPRMVAAEVVIATDYLKSFLAKFRNLFGGEVRSYQTMLTRAREEALLRLLEQVRAQGFDALCNVRYQTADVGGDNTRKKVAMAPILATGTAYYRRHHG
ncbi:MAG: heavy metal-binding domain-containing protein [Planctomycetaceae bacterium]